MKISQKIRQIRIKMNMTQADFGKEIGVCQNTVSQYETLGKMPSPKVMRRIVMMAKKVRIIITVDDIISDDIKDAIRA